MLTCAAIVRLITDYEEGSLSPAERKSFEEHVAICPPCRAYLTQMRRTIQLVGELREDDVPPEVEQHLVDAFRDWRPREKA